MIRDKLRSLDLRITELADYLQISRPTMYKFIEYYDNQNFDLINNKILKLFNYISENELISKKNVINYILNNLVEVKELGDKEDNSNFNKIKKFIIDNPESNKSNFINLIIKTNDFDDIINYLLEIHPLLHKRKLSESEKQKIDSLNEFKNKNRKKVNE